MATFRTAAQLAADLQSAKQKAISDLADPTLKIASSSPLSQKETDNLKSTPATVANATPATENKLKTNTQQDTTKDETKQKVGDKTIKSFKPIDNPLDDYATYTYGLSLHIITPEIYRKVVNDPTYTYAPNGNVLIASAGRRGENFKRAANFEEDFYFENFKFTTIIGLNAKTRSTNSVEVTFTIIEPYGITLLNRLLATADNINAKNWNQLPFMLEIEFYGNKDDGGLVNPISEHSKFIPVKIIDCKIKASTKGAEYQFTAIPYNHVAFLENTASTPAFFEVQATTVKDFFDPNGNLKEFVEGLDKKDATRAELQRQERISASANQYSDAVSRKMQSTNEAELKKSGEAYKTAAAKHYTITSYAAAMNSYQLRLEKSGQQSKADVYLFKFDEAIGNSTIVIPKRNEVKNTPMATKGASSGAANLKTKTGAAGPAATGIDASKQLFSLNAGTSIIEVINMVMKNSDYIRSQIKENGEPIKQDTPLNWYKIIPEVILGDFDNVRQVYQKTITYHITKYEINNTKFNLATKSLPTSWAKEYNYMFTGKNNSILDFSIDFNVMFYTAMTADREKIQKIAITADQPDKTNGPTPPEQSNSSIAINATQPVASQSATTSDTSKDKTAVSANDLAKSLMSTSRGDMINVKLKISGDPGLIKQDDVFYGPSKGPAAVTDTGVIDKHNSLITDASEIYAMLNFRSPSDIDQTTGLMDFTSWTTSVFSGIYRIITVENVFDRGQFTQTLDMIRMFEQSEYDTVKPKTADKNERQNVASTPAEEEANKKLKMEQMQLENAKPIPALRNVPENEKDTRAIPVVTTDVPASAAAERAKLKEIVNTAPTRNVKNYVARNGPEGTW